MWEDGADPNVLRSLQAVVATNPTGIATIMLSADGQRVSRSATWADVDAKVRRLADCLRAEGCIAPGQRLAVLGFNSERYLHLIFACCAVDAIIVLLNVRSSPEELEAAITDSGAVAVAAMDAALEKLVHTRIAPLVPCLRRVLSPPRDPSGNLWRVVELPRHDKPIAANGAGADDQENLGNLHCIVYTSGTTGRAKGVALTHRAQLVQAVAKRDILNYGPKTRMLSIAPLFHVGGLSSSVAVTLAGGCHVFLPRFNAAAALAAVEAAGVNLLVVVPAMLHAVITAAAEEAAAVDAAGGPPRAL
ncbi:unnamed protein product, partial [Phaeothamnion confervicola]